MEFGFERLDYVFYILLLQVLPLFAILSPEGDRQRLSRHIALLQVSLICIFFLAWGGYSTDAWRYLDRFDRSPFTFEREWGFWLLGSIFSYYLQDPWAMKLYSALCAGIAAGAIVCYLKRYGAFSIVIGLFLLVSTPAFIFGFGNTVRQGMGMAIMLPAIAMLADKRTGWFVVLTLLALMFHLSALLLAVAAAASSQPRVLAALALIVSPVAGLFGPTLLLEAGIDVGEWIPYAYREEGSLHIAKFVAVYPVAWIVFLLHRRDPPGSANLALTFVYAACFSFLLLYYEVPFERLLLYSLILLCVVVPPLAVQYLGSRRALLGAWLIGLIGSATIWTHKSSIVTLGYWS